MSNRTRAKVSSETSATSNGVNHKSSSSNNNKKGSLKQMERQRLRAERESLKLWLHPKDTSKYFLLECLTLARIYGRKFLHNKLYIAMIFTAALLLVVAFHIPGEHQKILETVKGHILFATYWLGLGVISSVGLGTGLHTFLLYLGPHIASVTLAAYECNSLDFPKPPYPDEIICPESTNANFVPSLWNIMSKVRLEAFLWGAGTALGELPPYFMAKAARLSGIDPDDDENNLKEFEELQKKRATGQHLSILEKGKLLMERIVERVGFFGILACASIPNPLFDLAGITCGHFLVPFATFFGATLIGKAIIKMHIQKIFVIMAFNEPLIAKVVDKIGHVPVVGGKLQEPFKAFLAVQKTRYHRKSANTKVPERANLLARLFEILVIAMILYFVLSIINAFAQNYHKRLHKKKQNTNSLKNKPKKD